MLRQSSLSSNVVASDYNKANHKQLSSIAYTHGGIHFVFTECNKQYSYFMFTVYM